MDNPEKSSRIRSVLQESVLPAAPLSMPEQVLVRQRMRDLLFRPIAQWLALR